MISKFNTTNYNSKLEYQIAVIDEEDNINPTTIHKKFYEDNLIYKNTIYSTGIEPIEASFTLKQDTFKYNKKYTIIMYGKDIYSNNVNYFYMEPKTLFIKDPSITNESNSTNSIEQKTDKITVEPSVTTIEEMDKNKEKDRKVSTIIIVFSFLLVVIIIGISIGLSIYY